jgi:hypothetical protein
MQQLASLADQFDIDVEVEIDDDDDPEGADGGHEPGDDLDVESKLHIETLFHTVAHDRSRAVELKAELDRLGVYEEYEDRFLDLFT